MLSLHFAIVLFVVGGLLVIVVGSLRGWRIAGALWFRLAHLAAIAIVIAQAWLGVVCPLTTLEMWLRARTLESTYTGSFIEHWLQRLMYFDAPPWAFAVAYSLFGLVVAGCVVVLSTAIEDGRLEATKPDQSTSSTTRETSRAAASTA